ncbi:MAG TPA: hypothetical protein VKA38_00565, partial [Draconibacterium sp.]|nr:hypothetical protein [Draconibacterium sp.]
RDTAYNAIINKLMVEVPKKFAKDAPNKNRFVFDPLNYTFTRKTDKKVFHGFSKEPDYSWITDNN